MQKSVFFARLMLPYFSRFTDKYHWAGLVLIMKRLLLALTPCLNNALGGGRGQLLWMIAILIASVFFNETCRPIFLIFLENFHFCFSFSFYPKK